MPRYKLTIEFDGSGFAGWQRQTKALSVQEAMETALAGFTGETVDVTGAGRTDAGVHALAMIAHIDLATERFSPEKLMLATNAHLAPAAISVTAVERVSVDFHARFLATWRLYRYRILNRRARPALERGRVWFVPTPLDADAMAAAAAELLGHHDFTTFRASRCQAKSPERTLERLSVVRDGDEIIIEVGALSFLHHQVRNIVGTLQLVGDGRWTPKDVRAALEARDRAAGGPTAPSDGLYLVRVDYD
jgi:tRNA pseudouridine38-40 synthase